MITKSMLALVLFSSLLSLAPPACPVTVLAQGVRGSQGTVGFVVFNSKAGWPEKSEVAFRSKGIPARPGDMPATFDMPAGRYAIAILHDENANKHLDRKPSGRPLEGYGLSNNPKILLKTPSFAAAAVDVVCGDRIVISVRYPTDKDGK